MPKECVLYYSPRSILRDLECNKGIDVVLEDLNEFRRQGLTFRVVDTTVMSEQEIQTAYIRATTPSVWKKYRVRAIFGTRRHAGCKFGRAVPALIIQSSSRAVVEDVFPHEEAGRIVTIREFLQDSVSVPGR